MTAQIIDLLAQLVTGTISSTGYSGIFSLMVLDAAGLIVPSEIIMPFSGFLASSGRLSFFWVIIVGALGNCIGAVIAYIVGYYGGRPFVLKFGKYFFITEKEVHRAEKFFARWGAFAILISRNLPFFRTFISLPAGVAEMNFLKFAFDSFVGSIPWCFAFTYLGFVLGTNWIKVRKFGPVLDTLTIIFILLIIGKIIYDYYHDGRVARK
jgi:membrane protein DedA with SNARE-associated domain